MITKNNCASILGFPFWALSEDVTIYVQKYNKNEQPITVKDTHLQPIHLSFITYSPEN